jgi:hypothetical protein
MEKINSFAARKSNLIADLIKFFLLAGIAIVAPLINQQMVTGPLVNSVLFISVVVLGIRWGLLVGMVPSVIALSAGLLPFVMAPMVPFIILGNAILVGIFYLLRNKNYWLGIFSAAVLKFLFLAGTSALMSEIFFKNQIGTKIAAMMAWPQLFTALAGGIIAYVFLRTVKKV